MHRGTHQYHGDPIDFNYGFRDFQRKEENMIEVVQQFREFKPYLKKRLAFIRQSGRALELEEEVENIEFYLEVMQDILADESHGVDQLRSYIDKIHEMIRKNPLTDFQGSIRRSLDDPEEFGDDDRPRSPSPDRRCPDAPANVPLIPTHGAHRTVEVNFPSRHEHHNKSHKSEEGFDEWGRPFASRREPPYKDVDMRGGYYQNNSSSMGRGQRRYSEEDNYNNGARGAGKGFGMGRGGSVPHHRQEVDTRGNRGRGFGDNDYDRSRSDYYRSHESKERERDFKPPDWLTGSGGGPSNGNSKFDEWQPKAESRDFRPDGERRNRDEEWRMNHNESREREEKYRNAQHIAKYFERRPSAEQARWEEKNNDDYISMFDRRSRNERKHDPNRHDSEYSRRSNHGDYHGRGRTDEERHEPRSRMDGGPYIPPGAIAQQPPPPLMTQITSIPIVPQASSMGYGVPQAPPHYTNPGLLPQQSPFINQNPGLLPLPVQNAANVGMGLVMPNVSPQIAAGVTHPMGFQQPPQPQVSTYPMSDIHTNSTGYRIPPVPLPRPPMPPSPIRTTAPLHPADHYQGPVPSGSPNYTSPAEPSAEQVREITMMKAKQCFGRVVSRSSAATTQPPSHSPSSMATASPGPTSPNNSTGSDNHGLDPRLNRARPPAVHHTVQSRHQSPPAPASPSPPPAPRANSAPRPDAGNVLRPSADPRSRNRFEQERKRIQETARDRFRNQDGHKSYNNNKKGSKMQELRKQLEKEGFHRLGRPAPRKQCGSFEDAITATRDEESESSKSGDKSKSPSSSSSHAKDKEGEHTSRQSRSQTEKTEREKSPPKKKSGDNKSKGKDKRKGSPEAKKKDVEEATRTRSPRRRSAQNEKADKTGGDKSSKTGDDSTSAANHVDIPKDFTKPPAFKIPRKPKPKQPEVVDPPTTAEDQSSSESSDKDVCTSPPASPEPALSQVPDSESRTDNADENENPSASTSKTAASTDDSTTSRSSDVNPNALEYLKQFLMTSADPEEREYLLKDPDNLKHIFFRIKSELSAAKGSRSENPGSTQVAPESSDQDKNQTNEEEEEVQERGRSREKKKNTKRRSSLEKLHDALKEMRFDTMLPLGPRRCTRIGQEEAAAESEQPSTDASVTQPSVVDESKEGPPEENADDADSEKSVLPTRKRGRPPKDSPKKKGGAAAKVIEEASEVDSTETEADVSMTSLEKTTPAARRGQKRKIKPVKVNARKRVKKTGPLTRAQAAMKNKGKEPAKTAEVDLTEGVTTRNKNKKQATNNAILRRLTRNRVCEKDTVINKDLCKIKLETDFCVNMVKSEPKETDPFLGGGPIHASQDQDHLADQLANIIDENLEDNDLVVNLGNQTEDNMDFNLDVFNTLDGDDACTDVCVKNELELSMEEAAAATELSFEGILGGPSLPKPAESGEGGVVESNNVNTPHVSSSDSNDTDKIIPSPVASSSPSPPPVSLLDDDEESLLDLPTPSCRNYKPKKPKPKVTATFETRNEGFTGMFCASEEQGVNTRGKGKGGRKSSPRKEPTPPRPNPSPNFSGAFSSSAIFSNSTAFSSPSIASTSAAATAAATSSVSTDVKPIIKTEVMDSSTDCPEIETLRTDVLSNKCEKCSFSGKKIVSHYVNKHYPCNIPQARLMPETFNGLIELNTSESPQLLEIVLDESQSPIWPCLYCDDRYDCIVDFYDHLTSHTGEFRYECGECGTSYPFHKSLVNHIKSHKGVSRNCIRFAFESVIEKATRELSGFLCNDCFYFQLRFESIIRHIEQTGHSSLDVRSVRLIRPSANGTFSSDTKVDLRGLVVKASERKLSPGKVLTSSKPTADEGVFFGTNANFTPPVLPSGEYKYPSPKVFEDKFLDTLKKKADRMERAERFSFSDDDTRGNLKKRKRNSSSPSPSRKSKEKIPLRVKIRRTYPKQKTRVEWVDDDTDSDDSSVEEPNDFLVPSEDSSSDSPFSSDDEDPNLCNHPDSTESDDGYKDGIKLRYDSLKSNEYLIRTRDMPIMERWETQYLEKHDLVQIKRAGDCFLPSVVMYGFIRPGISRQTPHKLRDQRELDKLCPTQGHRVLPVKCANKYAEMVKVDKLIHLFKCMSTVCAYTTDHPAEFLQHLTRYHFTDSVLHAQGSCSKFLPVRDVVMMKDADCCSYCAVRYREARDLVEHIMNQHAHSHYQCTKCFYRAFYHRYVIRHSEVEHPGEEVEVMKSPRLVDGKVEEATLFQIFVYKCEIPNPKCDKGKRFVFREDFMSHLRHCNANGTGTDYPCHLCKSTHTLEGLIEHYKTHNIFRFHCSYCAFGSEVKSDLDDHFVFTHPNTSGRVFYRVKSVGSNKFPRPIYPVQRRRRQPSPDDNDSRDKKSGDSDNGCGEGMDNSDNEDGERGRLINLKGRDLYRCVTGDCDYTAENHDTFKDHISKCSWVAESRSLACAHCERKMKTATNLLEHMKVHGEKKQTCSLCPFRCYTNTEITKHIKGYHRVMTHRVLKKEVCNTDLDPDLITYPKDVMAKSLVSAVTFENNYYSFAKKATYSLENIDKLPMTKVFSSDLNCAMCPYATKVRSNMVRHLYIHKQAQSDGRTVVPLAQRVNPVPYLSREGLEFDKMMNLAASSHKSSGGTATEAEVKKLPQFVKEQFRYVCSVCDHITSDETLLQTHIKVIHSEVTLYKCPHCQKHCPESRDNPDNTVSLDKIAFHLRLHGPKLYKCGHCKVAHHQLRLMEKHIPEKHPEKKPIHYLIRDLDADGVPLARPTTSGVNRRTSVEDSKGISTEKWKCFLCNSKAILCSWDDSKAHIEQVHKVPYQFMCLVCGFCTDEVTDMIKHCRERCRDLAEEGDKKRILVMFSKCETFDHDESTSNTPIWKRGSGPVRHIHGNFTEDSLTLIRQYNNQQGIVDLPAPSVSSPVKNSNMITVSSKLLRPSGSTAKVRRSLAGPSPSKANSAKGGAGSSSPQKSDVFKYHCNKCDVYKTKNPQELRVHLFNEFRYKRYVCLCCDTKFTTEKSLRGHLERDHQKSYHPDNFKLLPENAEIEAEIDECIERQTRKKETINSFAIERNGKLTCKTCREDGYTYDTFEAHILIRHSS